MGVENAKTRGQRIKNYEKAIEQGGKDVEMRSTKMEEADELLKDHEVEVQDQLEKVKSMSSEKNFKNHLKKVAIKAKSKLVQSKKVSAKVIIKAVEQRAKTLPVLEKRLTIAQ